ncbi:hypothetical protein KLP40_11735 [Hymenobacter sp. NST-14]|uniref:hypothetical protein n=1 Tax=Hymenobacter piscis TaxID=2839984 RepID=UPI001C02E270|nr:hypothetical protein [Hymenobacter piscis]MBT9393834.1 hypothetical protein [Hymenobacter piscis]
MKVSLLCSALVFLFLGTSCSSEDKMLERTGRYGTVSTHRTKRSNDKSRAYKQRQKIGLGLNLDLNAKDAQKHRTVDAPKKYKYSKGR